MPNCLVFEDGILTNNYINGNVLWDGLFSKVTINGKLIQYIQSCLPKNTVFIVPKSDGNINRKKDNNYHDVDWEKDIQPYIDYANSKNKVFILGVLCQVDEEKDINYIYLPLDDELFSYGIKKFFNKDTLLKWENRSSELCWRGGCSGVGGNESLRVRFVDYIYKYNKNTDVKLSNWWSEGKNIPTYYFNNRVNYTEFLKYKIFFIVDGNCIASNHMYGFASGSIPFLLSNSTCWFSHLITPYVHYIPVKYDLSNIIEQIEWVKNNNEKAKVIANNALSFSEKYFSSEYQKKYIKDTIENICKKKKKNIDLPLTTLQLSNKVVDCFTFYNEIYLLFYRLTILSDVVYKFILVESNYTHTGVKKELFYEKNKHLFTRWENKIIHIIVDLPFIVPTINILKNEQWINEQYQRNCIDNGIKQLTLNNDDLIIVSDLDEIINPNIIKCLINKTIGLDHINGFALSQDLYYYNLNTLHCEKWTRSKIVKYEYYKKTTPQEIRENNTLSILDNAGWHLSYFGDSSFIKNKLTNFGHQEYNNDFYKNEKNIENAINNNSDLFNRSYVPISYIDINKNRCLPPLYNKYLSTYVKQKQTNNTNNELILNVPIYIYFHICCINNWEEIVSRLFFKIKNSGLYSLVKEVRCVILGDYNNSYIFNDSKINIIFHSLDVNLYERKTINLLYTDCININEEFNVLYIHSKGVKHFNNLKLEKNVYDWVEYLAYFNIYNFELVLKELNNCQAVGVNLQRSDHDNIPLHYSGNFWWSKSSHIKNINEIIDQFYNSPEFWITSINGTYKSLWNSNTHHYDYDYHYSIYENKPIDNVIVEIK